MHVHHYPRSGNEVKDNGNKVNQLFQDGYKDNRLFEKLKPQVKLYVDK